MHETKAELRGDLGDVKGMDQMESGMVDKLDYY